MRAVCWHGVREVGVEQVPDPGLLNPRDAIVKVSSTAICGSDLHLYDGYIPTMFRGDILGHEFMGEVVEVGAGVASLHVGDRVVVPFAIACGQCEMCRRGEWSLCDNSNPNAWMLEKLYGASGAGLFAPAEGTSSDYAGQDVADPSPMLLATALLLSEGLGRTSAGVALEESLQAALHGGRRPLDQAAPGVAATTREFVDAVLGLLPSARRDTEFALGVWR